MTRLNTTLYNHHSNGNHQKMIEPDGCIRSAMSHRHAANVPFMGHDETYMSPWQFIDHLWMPSMYLELYINLHRVDAAERKPADRRPSASAEAQP
jgi:hypothetical protein